MSRNLRRFFAKGESRSGKREEVATYWTDHNVTQHHAFSSADESIDYFNWRNDQYFPYIDFMPVVGHDNKVVLDYGCGPGHDLVGFGTYSRPTKLIGMDVSQSSLEESRRRLKLHGIEAQLIALDPLESSLPLADGSVDYIHSSGVLHHVVNPVAVLREFGRILRADGVARVMVYNYDSLWLHLHVAYQKMVVEDAFPGLDLLTAFSMTTDGPDCPISRIYRPDSFVNLASEAGFAATFIGAAISMYEASLAEKRFEAIMDRRLPAENRAFLCGLRFDERGLPMHNQNYAGVDGCYELRKIGARA